MNLDTAEIKVIITHMFQFEKLQQNGIDTVEKHSK